MEEKISIIVPVYKVEKYLNKCVDSLICQTYQNLEIILVDDGSPDNCPKICDEYAKKDSRVKVVHKENGGLSDARNAGMKEITGEYVSFIDSDDYVSIDFFESLFNVMNKTQSDIVECSVLKVYEGRENDRSETNSNTEEVKVFNTEDALKNLILDVLFRQHVWNKLYKASVVKDILFEKGKLNEDEFWTYQVFGNAKKVARYEKSMYFYLQRQGSIMANGYSLKRLDGLEAKFNRQKYIDKKFPSVSQCAKINFYGSCIFSGQATLKYMKNPEKKQAMKIIKRYAFSSVLSKDDINNSNENMHFWFKLSKISFWLCCKIRAVTGIGF